MALPATRSVLARVLCSGVGCGYIYLHSLRRSFVLFHLSSAYRVLSGNVPTAAAGTITEVFDETHHAFVTLNDVESIVRRRHIKQHTIEIVILVLVHILEVLILLIIFFNWLLLFLFFCTLRTP